MARARPARGRDEMSLESDARATARLVKRYAELDAIAMAGAQAFLPAAAGDPVAVAAAIDKIQDLVNTNFPDSEIVAPAAEAGVTQNKRHERLFFAGLAVAIGIPIVGGDGLTSRPRIPAATLRRSRQILIPLPNAAPQLATEQLASNARFYIGNVREGISLGLRDAIVNEGHLLGRELNAEAMGDLISKWRGGSGVPSMIPTRRTNGLGQRVAVGTRDHTTMIAVDQMETHNLALNETRQTKAGVRRFVWQTRQDSRVRDKHRIWQSQVFTWTQGAPGNVFPGQEPRCRCRPTPVVDANEILRFGSFRVVDLTEEFSDRPLPSLKPSPADTPLVFTRGTRPLEPL